MKKLLLIIFLFPILLHAQTGDTDVNTTLNQNSALIEQFAQLAPMGINPYLTVFLTSVCAKSGFHNDYVATNPFFNNWFVLILFGILFFFTASVGTLFKTNKATATIGLVDTYLSNNSALIINAFIILAPSFITSEQVSNEIVYQAGFISISLKTILTLAVATYFLIIVMAVKFLIDILIFLSPIPFIDAVLEIIKIAAACVFVLISIISPITSVIIAGIMFITSIFFYKRSVRLITKIKYLIVHPILNIFRNKQVKLTDGKNLSILVLTGSKVGGLSEGKIVRLQQDNDEFKLIHKRFFRADLTVKIDFADFTFTQNHLDLKLVNHNDSISLVLNRTYHKYLEELSDSLGAEIKEKKEFNLNLHTSILNRIKNFFRKSDIAELKSITSL